jgi:hypothetical protein
MPERGARMARREKRANRDFVSDEQRRQPGCPARQAVVIQRGQATSGPFSLNTAVFRANSRGGAVSAELIRFGQSSIRIIDGPAARRPGRADLTLLLVV